jgi:Na+-driven multidrug efflux pump
MLATGSAYLRAVGPFYGFFGLGLALYFASQGAGRLTWPLIAGFARMFVAIGLGALALRWTGSLSWLFACLGLGLVTYGTIVATAVSRGSWFAKPSPYRVDETT